LIGYDAAASASPGERVKMTHRTTTAPLSLLALALAMTVGCGGDKETAAPASSSAAEASPATPAADAEKAPPVAEKTKVIEGGDPADDRYTLKIDPPAEAAVGAEGKVKVTVVPKAPWHMNLDYPTSLAMNPAADVTLAKAEQKMEDVLRLEESGCEYEVAFTPTAAGDKSFTGEIKFAVCQDDACAPVTKSVEFQVAVK